MTRKPSGHSKRRRRATRGMADAFDTMPAVERRIALAGIVVVTRRLVGRF